MWLSSLPRRRGKTNGGKREKVEEEENRRNMIADIKAQDDRHTLPHSVPKPPAHRDGNLSLPRSKRLLEQYRNDYRPTAAGTIKSRFGKEAHDEIAARKKEADDRNEVLQLSKQKKEKTKGDNPTRSVIWSIRRHSKKLQPPASLISQPQQPEISQKQRSRRNTSQAQVPPSEPGRRHDTKSYPKPSGFPVQQTSLTIGTQSLLRGPDSHASALRTR